MVHNFSFFKILHESNLALRVCIGIIMSISDIDSVTTGQGPELQCLLKVKEDLS